MMNEKLVLATSLGIIRKASILGDHFPPKLDRGPTQEMDEFDPRS